MPKRFVDKRQRIAKLTLEENKAWEFAFSYHKVKGRCGDLEADRRSWQDLVKEFPRLAQFDGCR